MLKVAPNATGQPVIIQKSGETVIRAFIEAGAWAVLAICVLLLIVLRRISDMLLTIIPLLLAGVVTLEIVAIVPIKLNFANIIALPLLLGLGVAFKIYFVMAWRAGATNLLESSLTRAVFFSALTSATAFGSLWFSRYPGMASMGELLVIALGCTMAAAVFFQPILMGRRAKYRERKRFRGVGAGPSLMRLWISRGAKVALAPFYGAAYRAVGCHLRHEKPNRRLEFVRMATHNVA